jgi:hypothetical protein
MQPLGKRETITDVFLNDPRQNAKQKAKPTRIKSINIKNKMSKPCGSAFLMPKELSNMI